jgi:hypothetical protein
MAQAFVIVLDTPDRLSKRRRRVAAMLIGSSERCLRRPLNVLRSNLVRQGSFELLGSMGLARRFGNGTAKGDFGRRHRR